MRDQKRDKSETLSFGLILLRNLQTSLTALALKMARWQFMMDKIISTSNVCWKLMIQRAIILSMRQSKSLIRLITIFMILCYILPNWWLI